jgi:hypothetical protein
MEIHANEATAFAKKAFPKGQASATRALVEAILQRAENYTWEVPANGRLTLVLEPNVTVVNVFESKYRQLGTTAIHSHTVGFRSEIVGGVMRQHRYRRRIVASKEDLVARSYWEQELTLDGKLSGEPSECCLAEQPIEVYAAGEYYEIAANEIHQSVPEDGTVTLVTRQYLTNPRCVSTFWPYTPLAPGAKPSGKIIPQPAASEVIADVISCALSTWF